MSKNNKNLKNRWLFILLLTLVAVAVAGLAAYFSVFGLSKLFAGAGASALILFGSLELGKLVGVSVLYRFWKEFNRRFKSVFISMIVVIMFITSMGIYGYLRNAYDVVSNKYGVVQKETKISENKKAVFQLEIDRYQKEIDSKNNQINTYIGNRTTQEGVISNLYNRSVDTTLSSGQSASYRNRASETQNQIKSTDAQINDLRDQNAVLYSKINSLNDSITAHDRKIIEFENTDVSVEIGPFKYIADLTGMDMDNVVGILIFMIMFVFDPFAIFLIIVANKLSMATGKKEEEEEEHISTVNRLKNLFKKKTIVEPVITKLEPIEPYVVDVPVITKLEPIEPDVIIIEPTPIEPDVIDEPEIEVEIVDTSVDDSKKNEFFQESCPEGYSEKKIDLDTSDIKEGLKVYHDTFGEGRILKSDLDKNRVIIQFDDFGIKELYSIYANLSEIKCVKDEEIESVKYLDFFEDDPEIQDIISRGPNKPVIEDPVIDEPVAEIIIDEPIIEPVEELPIEEVIEEPIVEEPTIEQIVEEPIIEPIIEPIVKEVIEEPIVEPDQKKRKLFQKWMGKKII